MNTVVVEKTAKHLIIKIPLRSVERRGGVLSSKAQRTVDRAIAQGIGDVARGHVFGPFQDMKEFRRALPRQSRK